MMSRYLLKNLNETVVEVSHNYPTITKNCCRNCNIKLSYLYPFSSELCEIKHLPLSSIGCRVLYTIPNSSLQTSHAASQAGDQDLALPPDWLILILYIKRCSTRKIHPADHSFCQTITTVYLKFLLQLSLQFYYVLSLPLPKASSQGFFNGPWPNNSTGLNCLSFTSTSKRLPRTNSSFLLLIIQIVQFLWQDN